MLTSLIVFLSPIPGTSGTGRGAWVGGIMTAGFYHQSRSETTGVCCYPRGRNGMLDWMLSRIRDTNCRDKNHRRADNVCYVVD
jgi:hypothetical protein